jgi:hypothetical protein
MNGNALRNELIELLKGGQAHYNLEEVPLVADHNAYHLGKIVRT